MDAADLEGLFAPARTVSIRRMVGGHLPEEVFQDPDEPMRWVTREHHPAKRTLLGGKR